MPRVNPNKKLTVKDREQELMREMKNDEKKGDIPVSIIVKRVGNKAVKPTDSASNKKPKGKK